MQPVAYFFFEHSTKSAAPWAAAGYRCYCIDIQHPAGETDLGNGLVLVGADIMSYQPAHATAAFACAFPPCTDLAVSGARWFSGKGLYALSDAIRLFARAAELCQALGCEYYLENPVSTISTYWRKPDYQFDPCDYAGYLAQELRIEEAYTKRTCLWCSPGFVMPVKKPVVPLLGSKMHLLPPSADRANLRSETAHGFAKAVFEANSTLQPTAA